MEAEGADEIEPALRRRIGGGAVVGAEALDEKGRVVLQFAAGAVGRRVVGGRLGRQGVPRPFQPKADHADPPSIGLVRRQRLERRRQIGDAASPLGETFEENPASGGGMLRDRQQFVQAAAPGEVLVDGRGPEPPKRLGGDVGRHEGIAVAVAAHPRAETEEGRQAERLAREAVAEAPP